MQSPSVSVARKIQIYQLQAEPRRSQQKLACMCLCMRSAALEPAGVSVHEAGLCPVRKAHWLQRVALLLFSMAHWQWEEGLHALHLQQGIRSQRLMHALPAWRRLWERT